MQTKKSGRPPKQTGFLNSLFMTKILHFLPLLTGEYEIINTGTFINRNNGLRLYIGKSSSPNKPNEILLYFNSETNRREYISAFNPLGFLGSSGLFGFSNNPLGFLGSSFPADGGGYCFDRSGNGYRFEIHSADGIASVYQCNGCKRVIHSWYLQRGKSHR